MSGKKKEREKKREGEEERQRFAARNAAFRAFPSTRRFGYAARIGRGPLSRQVTLLVALLVALICRCCF